MMPFITSVITRLDRLVDWFIPADIAADKDRRKQARLFLISHLLGPFIGNSVPLALYYFDPMPKFDIAVLAVSITGFWVFPFVLKHFGHYNFLALLSIQNLIFAILWSCFFYGGVTSPTVPWVLTIPLLSFFYIGDSQPLRIAVLTIFAVNIAVFGGFYLNFPAPHHGIPNQYMEVLGLISTIAAAMYVTMMAVYYAKALASQSDLESVMRGHMTTAKDLRLATTEAVRASSAKSEFLAKMSHELRTPLNAVIGYSQMLLEEAVEDNDPENVADLDRIHVAGQNLLKLVNNVLDLSKLEAGHMEIFNEDFSLQALITATVEKHRQFATSRNNELLVDMEEGAGIVCGDVTKIQTCLSNIVENALKYTEDGIVHVTGALSKSGQKIVIQVSDTGIGIDSKDLPALFEQFAVVDDETSTKYGGTGVGLALTRKLCRMMGGEVTVKTALGKGSTFTMILPQQTEHMIEKQMDINPVPPNAALKTDKIPDYAGDYTEEQRKVA